jgi:hypothetical protein
MRSSTARRVARPRPIRARPEKGGPQRGHPAAAAAPGRPIAAPERPFRPELRHAASRSRGHKTCTPVYARRGRALKHPEGPYTPPSHPQGEISRSGLPRHCSLLRRRLVGAGAECQTPSVQSVKYAGRYDMATHVLPVGHRSRSVPGDATRRFLRQLDHEWSLHWQPGPPILDDKGTPPLGRRQRSRRSASDTPRPSRPCRTSASGCTRAPRASA